MHGTELCVPECCALSPLGSPSGVFFPPPSSMLPGAPQSLSKTGPVARDGLSLPSNGSRFRGLHSRIDVPGLPLRSLHCRSQARSAFCSTAECGSPRSRLSPRFCPSPACFRARSASPPASTPLGDFYIPPDQSVQPDSKPISPPSGHARSPLAPHFPLSIASRGKRIIVPGPLRFRRLAVPQTSWNLPHYAPGSCVASRIFGRKRLNFNNFLSVSFQ
jgi:hypothetical protein